MPAKATTSTPPISILDAPPSSANQIKTDTYSSASIAAGFGVAAGTFAIMFFDSVPKVKEDILKKVPFIASFYTTEIAPEDNPF